MKRLLFVLIPFVALTACSKHHDKYLGYIEGRYVYLAAPVSGELLNLAVHKGETVTQGQLAFQLDTQPELSELQNAQAQLRVASQDLKNLEVGERTTVLRRYESQMAEAKANLVYSQKMYERNQKLRATNVISEASLDLSRSQYQSDVEKLNAATANLNEAKLGARDHLILSQEAKVSVAESDVKKYQWMVDQKAMHIPQNGFVQDTLYRQNEYVPAGKPVIQFLPPENRLVIFFVPEEMLSTIHPGNTIKFTCDGCQKNLTATISYISSRAEYTPPVIYSKDSRGKLVYWIEAKVDPAIAAKVNPGEPVEVFV